MLKASCLCVTFERVALLEEAIESFLRQTWPERELIVLNDAPGQRLVFAHPRVRIVNATTRYASLGAKRNACAALATGDVFFPWDDDDLPFPDHIAQAITRMRNGYFSPGSALGLFGGVASFRNFGPILQPACAIARDLFERAGGYPDDLTIAEDHALFDRMRAVEPSLGATHVADADVTFYYRFGAWRHATFDGLLAPSDSDSDAAASGPREIALTPLWHDDYPRLARTIRLASIPSVVARDAGPPPRVSCLAVLDGAKLSAEARAAYERQDVVARELVVVTRHGGDPGESEVACWKRGLARCRAPWIALWDEAVHAFPWHLATALRALEAGDPRGVYRPDRWIELRGGEAVVSYDTGPGVIVVAAHVLSRALDMIDGSDGAGVVDDDALLDALEAVAPALGAYTHAGEEHLGACHRASGASRWIADERLVDLIAPHGRARVPHVFAQVAESGADAVASWLHLAPSALPLRSHPRLDRAVVRWSLVRDPWQRALANFIRVRSAAHPSFSAHPHRDAALAVDFARFVELAGELRPGARRITEDASGFTMRPQIDHLVDDEGRLLTDLMLRHEQLAEDLAWLSAAIDGPPVSELGDVRALSRDDTWRGVFEREPRLVDLVAERYGEDLTAFGYAFDETAPDIAVLCINRREDVARWARIQDMSARRGYPTERVDAVTGDAVDAGDAHERIRTRSHLGALQRFLDTGREWGLILEDDVTLMRPYASLRCLPADADLIVFGWRSSSELAAPRRFRPFERLRGTPNYPVGAHCYAVRRPCARYLLHMLATLPPQRSVDDRYRVRCDDLIVYAAGHPIDPFGHAPGSSSPRYEDVVARRG